MEKEFIKLIDKFLADTDKIDDKTPWEEREPEWWLKMMWLRELAQQVKNGLNHTNTVNKEGLG